MWLGFNVKVAAGMIREAAAMTTQIKGEVIPSDKPGSTAMAVRRPVGVLVGMAPWNAPIILCGARLRHADRLRKYCGSEGIRTLPRDSPYDRGGFFRKAGLPDRRPERHYTFCRGRA